MGLELSVAAPGSVKRWTTQARARDSRFDISAGHAKVAQAARVEFKHILESRSSGAGRSCLGKPAQDCDEGLHGRGGRK